MEDILEYFRRSAEETKERVVHIIYDEDLDQFPSRVLESVVGYMNASLDAVTGHGTMLPSIPHIPLPAAMTDRHSVVATAPVVPPTLYQRVIKHIDERRFLYSILGGTTFALFTTTIAANWSPRFRGTLFGQVPFLRRIIYVRGHPHHHHRKGMRPLPPHPRPRFSADGSHRLEAVLVLGAEQESYGREVAKFFASKDFIVVATISSLDEIDELESLGKGFIKAIVLDPSSASSSLTNAFLRSLNAALSLRYPLHSAGDPFHNISSSNLQLVSVINCLPLSSPPSLAQSSSSTPLPIEAISLDNLAQILQSTVTTSISVIQKILPLLRNPRAHKDVTATIITCLPGPERYLGTPFSGTSGAFRGIASNALVSALDVLRRELAASSSTGERKREIKIVNLDIGFMEPVRNKLHSQASDQAKEEKQEVSVASRVDDALPRHLKELYAPALTASWSFENRPQPHGEEHEKRSRRKGLKDSRALSEKLLSIVLAKKGSHISDRTSVGAGVTSYYIASLLPTSFIDVFFSWRHRVLLSRYGRGHHSKPASRGPLPPLPLPGYPSPPSPSSAIFGSSEAGERVAGSSSGSSSSESGGEQGIHLPHESDTILPIYAPSAPASTAAGEAENDFSSEIGGQNNAASGSAFSQSGYAGSELDDRVPYSQSEMARSGTLGESYVQL